MVYSWNTRQRPAGCDRRRTWRPSWKVCYWLMTRATSQNTPTPASLQCRDSRPHRRLSTQTCSVSTSSRLRLFWSKLKLFWRRSVAEFNPHYFWHFNLGISRGIAQDQRLWWKQQRTKIVGGGNYKNEVSAVRKRPENWTIGENNQQQKRKCLHPGGLYCRADQGNICTSPPYSNIWLKNPQIRSKQNILHHQTSVVVRIQVNQLLSFTWWLVNLCIGGIRNSIQRIILMKFSKLSRREELRRWQQVKWLGVKWALPSHCTTSVSVITCPPPPPAASQVRPQTSQRSPHTSHQPGLWLSHFVTTNHHMPHISHTTPHHITHHITPHHNMNRTLLD